MAVTGAKAATPLFQSMEVLGLDMVRMRLRRAIESLGGISSKKMKALEKDVLRRPKRCCYQSISWVSELFRSSPSYLSVPPCG